MPPMPPGGMPMAGAASGLSAITASELLHGVHRADGAVRRGRREAFVETILTYLPVLPFTLDIARVHARLWADLQAQGEMIGSHDLDGSFALLDAAEAMGCNILDTALIYRGGDSERVLGQWLQARGNRDDLILLTKGAHPNQDRRRVTHYDIASDLHDSLARLHTDHVDIYLLHRDDETQPVGPIVEALNEHHAAGRIGLFGGSN